MKSIGQRIREGRGVWVVNRCRALVLVSYHDPETGSRGVFAIEPAKTKVNLLDHLTTGAIQNSPNLLSLIASGNLALVEPPEGSGVFFDLKSDQLQSDE